MRILAIDLGTSSVKLVRIDEDARVLSIDRVPLTGLTVARWVEILRQNLLAHGDHRDIGGIAITGQMHGLMTREGDAWGEGIPWHDTRSAPLIPSLQARIGADAAQTSGGPVAPGFLAASLMWVREHDPTRWERITSVHLPKDALIHELTGEHVTDPSDAAGTGLFAPASGDWAWPIIDALQIPRPWLARLMPSGSIAGGLRPEYALLLGLPRGLPIILAGGDAPTGAFGMGVTRAADALIMLSTGAQVILPSRTYAPDRAGRWYAWPSVAPESDDVAPYLRVGTLMNAGNVTHWLDTVLGQGPMTEEPSRLIALPHLIGTREQPDLRGAVLGIDETTTPGDLRRALVEGVAFSIRATMAAMRGDEPLPSRIRLGGGLAQRTDVRQLIANVLGHPVETIAEQEPTAYGAGLLALRNLTGDLPSDARADSNVTSPRADADYDDRYALYRDVERALTPLAARLGHL